MLVRGRSLWKNGFAAASWFPVTFLPGIYQEISALFVSRTARRSRTTERSESVSEEAAYLRYRILCLRAAAAFFSCHMKHFSDTLIRADIVSQYTLR
jgi:hypothetical protein